MPTELEKIDSQITNLNQRRLDGLEQIKKLSHLSPGQIEMTQRLNRITQKISAAERKRQRILQLSLL